MTAQVDVEALDRWIREFAGLVAANKDLLTQLDSAIGDADHGANMDRGMTAVVAALDVAAPAGAAALLKQVGMTLVSTVGGASGPLYGTFFLRMATASGETTVTGRPGVRQGSARRARGCGRPRQGGGRRQDDVRRAGPGRRGAGRRAGRRCSARRGAPRCRPRRRARPGRHDPDARPQGPGELPRGAQRRPPGPRRDVRGAARRRRRCGAGRSRGELRRGDR